MDNAAPNSAHALYEKRALVVAATPALAQQLSALLHTWGMTAHAARSDVGALAALRQSEPFDVALIAAGPKGHVRPGVITAIRALRPASELPIVVLGLPQLGEEGYRVAATSAQALIPHPLRPAQLYAVLVSLLTGAKHAPGGGAPPPPPQPLRVLLADDDPTNRFFGEHLLRLLGHHVTAVDDGRAALATLEGEPYDVALLDIEMPELDGNEVARRVRRSQPPGKRPVLIALTANIGADERERCLEAGMDDFLGKPLGLDTLAETLGRSTAARWSREPATPPQPPLDATALLNLSSLLRSCDPQAAGSIVDIYLHDSATIVADMRLAAQNSSRAELGHLAHKLRSSSAIIGASRLSDLCYELEQSAGLEQGAKRWPDLVSQIAAEHTRVVESLRSILSPGAC